MRLPALAIAACYAGGVGLGLSPWLARHSVSRVLFASLLTFTAVLLVIGFFLAARRLLFSAVSAALCAWLILGVTSGLLADQPRPANYIINLVQAGVLDLHTPLRWHGVLRDEPSQLPWGSGFDVELEGVEQAGGVREIQGGLRLAYSPKSEDAALPDLDAGDNVAVLTEARLPQVFRDEGAFDRRAYLAQQGIDLTATLRAPKLLVRTVPAKPSIRTNLARLRGRLRDKLSSLFATQPDVAATLRAMLLGDRSFIERAEAVQFQKTGVFHVLVVAGLHVGAFAAVLFWLGRRLRVNVIWTVAATLILLAAYVSIVEQRPPVLRAALMAGLVVLARIFYRRLELLNSAALAALVLLIANPAALRDSSFQLTFAAVGCIAGLGLPWLEHAVQPYARAMRGWRDVTRDAAHEPRAAQFRIDLRGVLSWATRKIPAIARKLSQDILVGGLAGGFRAWELLVLTMVLQLGMLPWMARDFHRVTLSGPFANLAVVPLTGAIIPLGFITLILAWIFAPFAKAAAWVLGGMIALLLHIVGWLSALPRWSYRIPGPPIWLFALFCVATLLLAVSLRVRQQSGDENISKWTRRTLVLCFVGGAILIATHPFPAVWTRRKLELTVMDVGQGDSLLVVSPNGHTLLIDGGGAFAGFSGRELRNGVDPGEDAVSPYLWSRGFRRIDAVALTHAHQDHLGGLTAVLENFSVGELWLGREISSRPMRELEELARQRRVTIRSEFRGQKFYWDGAQGEFLWPESAQTAADTASNNDSLVLRLRYGDEQLLLPGDAEKQAEHEFLRESEAHDLRSDVLKIGHHGSKNSTIPELLEAVRPRVAIISVGEENPYGHPSPELLERLDAAQVRILRTDRNGAVHVLTDGKSLQITCFVACDEAHSLKALAQAKTPNEREGNKQK